MRKIALAMVAVAGMMMASCGGNEKAGIDSGLVTEKAAIEESVCVAGDSCDEGCPGNDSVVARAGGESEGFGRCLQSGCNCKSFEGRGQTCRNCGHAYKKHY